MPRRLVVGKNPAGEDGPNLNSIYTHIQYISLYIYTHLYIGFGLYVQAYVQNNGNGLCNWQQPSLNWLESKLTEFTIPPLWQ